MSSLASHTMVPTWTRLGRLTPTCCCGGSAKEAVATAAIIALPPPTRPAGRRRARRERLRPPARALSAVRRARRPRAVDTIAAGAADGRRAARPAFHDPPTTRSGDAHGQL